MHGKAGIQVVLARIGNVDCDSLLPALEAEGWSVEAVDDLEHLLATIDTGRHHGAVVACEEPWLLPKAPMRTLMSFQGSMALSFLVENRPDAIGCPALIGATSDQIHALGTPPDALVRLLKNDLMLAVLYEPRFTLLCIDDDREFLRSLEQFLPPRIEEAFPRFTLDFEFIDSSREALALVEQMEENRLALVISDEMMPEMKGVELLTRIRRLCPRAQRVLLTGHAGLEAAIRAINERALDKYFTKPIEQSADFVVAIRQLLHGFHLQLSGEALRHRLMAQFEFIRVVSGAHDVAKVLAVTTAFVREQSQAVGVAVALLENDHLTVQAVEGKLVSLPANSTLATDAGLGQWLLQHRQPVVANHAKDLPDGVGPDPRIPMPLMAVPLVAGEKLLGAVLVSGRADGGPFSREERMLLSFIADAASVTLGGLRDREAIEHYYVNTIASLMEAVEAKDHYTRGHTDRVMELAVRLAKQAGLAGKDLTDVGRAAALHDIGKIAIPESIIAKPGKLDPEELALMRMHCERGAKIVRHLSFLDDARRIMVSHHERYDGGGYPHGLKGDQIPLGARILGIVDSYDAMTSDRPYRKAKSMEEALAEIEASAGEQFDPELVPHFIKIIRETMGAETVEAGQHAE